MAQGGFFKVVAIVENRLYRLEALGNWFCRREFEREI
jgi:hypothetical protein